MQAERDSRKRKESVDNVCKALNPANVLQPIKNDRRSMQKRLNVLDHLIVNEKHKVMFCFIPKISCTGMKKIFLVMEDKFPSIENVTYSETHLRGSLVLLKSFPPRKREYMLKNFYKFVIVRDPFERLVSAYRDKLENYNDRKFFIELGSTIVRRYRYNNSKFKILPEHGYNVRFPEYVRHLIDSPTWKLNEHWLPYFDLCRPCEIKYDFIGSIDTLEQDVRHVMREIHANETKYYIKKSKGSLHTTKTKQTTASYFKEISKKDFEHVLAIYKEDHELFGYPLPEYETLDKRYPA